MFNEPVWLPKGVLHVNNFNQSRRIYGAGIPVEISRSYNCSHLFLWELPLLSPFDNMPYCHRVWHNKSAVMQTPPRSPLWDLCTERTAVSRKYCNCLWICSMCKFCGHGGKAGGGWGGGARQPGLEGNGKGAEMAQTSQAPCPQPDSWPRSGIAPKCFCFKPMINWFEWLPSLDSVYSRMKEVKCWKVEHALCTQSLELGFLLWAALWQCYSPDRGYWSFSATLQQFRKPLWCYRIFVPEVFG